MPFPRGFFDNSDVPDDVIDWLAEDWDTEEWESVHFRGDPSGWELEVEYADGSTATIDLSAYDDWYEWMWDVYDFLSDEIDEVDVSYTED